MSDVKNHDIKKGHGVEYPTVNRLFRSLFSVLQCTQYLNCKSNRKIRKEGILLHY